MMGLTTRGLRLNPSIFKLTLKDTRKFLFYHCNNLEKNCVEGYVLSCDKRNLIKESKIHKKNSLLTQISNIGVHRILSTEKNATPINFEKASEETLESLSEYFDEIIEEAAHLQEADVSYGDGVLTVKFGHDYGTYVINRQIPNQQIWLSSPTSGPKRYDFINGSWVYKHDGKSLYELLNEEIPVIVKFPVSFSKCSNNIKHK